MDRCGISILRGKLGTLFLVGRVSDCHWDGKQGLVHVTWDRRGGFLHALRLVRLTLEESVMTLNAFGSMPPPVFFGVVSGIVLCWNFFGLGKLYPKLTFCYFRFIEGRYMPFCMPEVFS